ncbi:MAG: Fur family transcriptional regulator [Sedimentibacter sp.]
MIEDILKNAMLKSTKQRCFILSIIDESKEPLAAEEVFKLLQDESRNINLSTVYRTLNILTEKNVLLKIVRGDGTASFQLNNSSHNHYITCCVCNRSVPIDSCPIQSLSEKIKNETGFEVTGHSLQISGICAECLKKSKEKK